MKWFLRCVMRNVVSQSVRTFFRRFFAFLLAASFLTLSIYDSVMAADYSGDLVDQLSIASGSDAEILNYSSLSISGWNEIELTDYDPLANLSEEELEAYYNTYAEYPNTLSWPEELPRFYFAVALGAAAISIFKIILAACGICAILWTDAQVTALWRDYEIYARVEGNPGILGTLDAILSAGWGATINGITALRSDFQGFLADRVVNYGQSGDQSVTITPTSAGGPFTKIGTYNFTPSSDWVKITGTVTSPIYCYLFLHPKYSETSSAYTLAYVSNDKFYIPSNASSLLSGTNFYYTYATTSGLTAYDNFMLLTQSVYPIVLPEMQVDDFKAYVRSADFELGSAAPVFVPVTTPWIDLQEEKYANVENRATAPASPEAADELEKKILAAPTGADVAKVLTDAGVLDVSITGEGAGEGEDDKDQTYPWLPDITGWLEHLGAGIDGIQNGLASIPETLTHIGENISALPQSIAQGLQDTLIGEDTADYSISSVVVDKFPFCVPFDLVDCVRVLSTEAIAPVWTIPFYIDLPFFQFHYDIVIDLTGWDRPVAVIRFFILIIYIAALVYATRYLVKG